MVKFIKQRQYHNNSLPKHADMTENNHKLLSAKTVTSQQSLNHSFFIYLFNFQEHRILQQHLLAIAQFQEYNKDNNQCPGIA